MSKLILTAVLALGALATCDASPSIGILESFTGAGPAGVAPDCRRLDDAEAFAAAWKELDAGAEVPAVDFENAVVVAVTSDFGIPRSAFTAELVTVEETRRLRVRHRPSQVKGEPPRRTVYGFYVLPKAALPLAVEMAESADKARGTDWKEMARFE